MDTPPTTPPPAPQPQASEPNPTEAPGESRAEILLNARRAAVTAARQATQRHLDGRQTRQAAHVASLEAALATAIARGQPARAAAELTRQLAEARRAARALRPAMTPPGSDPPK